MNFYIFAFLGVRMPGKLRFTGGPSLKEVDLGALGRFLPGLGARLVPVVPGTRGLPVNIECSGELPDELVLPDELPDEAVMALMMAAVTWRRRISISLAGQSQARQARFIDLAKRSFVILPGLAQALENSIEYTGYAVSDLNPPAEIKIPLDPVMSAVILVLPLFTGGNVTLAGKWIDFCQSSELANILNRFGLEIKGDDVAVSSALLPDSVWPESLELEHLSPHFHPLFWVLNARLAARAGGPVLIRSHPEGADLDLAEDFLAQIGFKLEQAEGGLRLSPMDAAEFKTMASKTYGWPCPSLDWGLGMALGAFIRPNLKISNPDCVSKLWPDFWYFYNRLPSPQVRKAGRDDDVPGGAPASAAVRRRIKTNVVVEPEPRDTPEDLE